MENKKTICDSCGRELHDESEYLHTGRGYDICKCCAFDGLYGSYVEVAKAMRLIEIAATRYSEVAEVYKEMLDTFSLETKILFQLSHDDADDTEAEA